MKVRDRVHWLQKARVAYAMIPDEAKRKILQDNAAALLGMS